MKKLLIIQKDEAYFLFETLQVLEKNSQSLKEFEVTILADANAIKENNEGITTYSKHLTSEIGIVLKEHYDISVNLSMNESSWVIHGEIHSNHKIGPYSKSGQLIVEDLWSTYLLTLKAGAPFLNFHLQDIYKNILGFKNSSKAHLPKSTIKQIAIGGCSPHFFSTHEQEQFIHLLAENFNGVPIKDLSEIDLIDDVTNTLYIGAANIESLKLSEAGARGIFLFSAFQGFNLLPYSGNNLIVSSNSKSIKAVNLYNIVESELFNKSFTGSPYSIYKIDHEIFAGAYLKSMNQSDNNYPFYQAYLVLWNFLLSTTDTQLEVSKLSQIQIDLFNNNQNILSKFIRLYDYAMASINIIHQESKSHLTDVHKIEGHLKNLGEIDKISDQLAAGQSLLRPILDFYRIRRSQNFGDTLFNQSQSSFLTYAEEHHALKALQELFIVTLRKNEANL